MDYSSNLNAEQPDFFLPTPVSDVTSATPYLLDYGGNNATDPALIGVLNFWAVAKVPMARRLLQKTWSDRNRQRWHVPYQELSAFRGEVDSILLLAPVSQSPFDVIYKSKDYATKLEEIVSSFRQNTQAEITEQVAARIQQLADFVDDDDVAPNLESLRQFFGFIEKNRNLEYPAISITPSGNIYSQWRVSASKKFSVEFLPTGSVQFVLFSPNEREIGLIHRISGFEFVDTILLNLREYHIQKWIAHGTDNT